MNVRKHFSTQCPFCQAGIMFYKVKPRFSCPECKAKLGSNRSTVDVWAVLIYVLSAAVIWIVGTRVLQVIDMASYQFWAVVSGVIAIAAYCLLAPHALRLGPDTWSDEAASGSAGGKRKSAGYRSGGNAGAEKRSP